MRVRRGGLHGNEFGGFLPRAPGVKKWGESGRSEPIRASKDRGALRLAFRGKRRLGKAPKDRQDRSPRPSVTTPELRGCPSPKGLGDPVEGRRCAGEAHGSKQEPPRRPGRFEGLGLAPPWRGERRSRTRRWAAKRDSVVGPGPEKGAPPNVRRGLRTPHARARPRACRPPKATRWQRQVDERSWSHSTLRAHGGR